MLALTDSSVTQSVCLLVGNPAKAAENKQLPLIAAHTNILNRHINYLCFTCISGQKPETYTPGIGWEKEKVRRISQAGEDEANP